jgi:hypothetical protein
VRRYAIWSTPPGCVPVLPVHRQGLPLAQVCTTATCHNRGRR